MVRALRGALALAAAVSGTACGQVNTAASLPATSALYESAPPRCQGQRKTRQYAQLKVRLTKQGGSFCVPEFGGFGGAMQYPGVERAVRLVLRSSIENIYNVQLLGAGTPIFYLNLHFLAGTHFGATLPSGNGLTSKKIVAGQPYTAFGVVAVGHLELEFPPCYAIATQGTYGGVLSSLGALFAGTTVTGPAYGAIEVYSGEQVTQEC